MTIPEMKARFREIMPSLGEFIMEWNRSGKKDAYSPAELYRLTLRNVSDMTPFEAYSVESHHSWGYYSWDDIDKWLFSRWNKINGMFADEFLETFAVCNIPSETVEELL